MSRPGDTAAALFPGEVRVLGWEWGTGDVRVERRSPRWNQLTNSSFLPSLGPHPVWWSGQSVKSTHTIQAPGLTFRLSFLLVSVSSSLRLDNCICCPGSLWGLNEGVYTRHLGECVTYNRCSIKAIGSFTIEPKHPGSFLCTTVFPLCYQLAHTECSDGRVNSAPPPCSASKFPKCPCLYL